MATENGVPLDASGRDAESSASAPAPTSSSDDVKSNASSPKTQLRVGRLVKAHGLKGAFKVELYTDDPDSRFTPGASFTPTAAASPPIHQDCGKAPNSP